MDVIDSLCRALLPMGLAAACASGTHPAVDPGSPSASAAVGGSDAAPGAPEKLRPKPPSPASVTIQEPGGDAENPEEAALFRQLDEPWGLREDKDAQLFLPLPDAEHWKRVRYWGVEHFVGFRYGNEHRVMAIGFVQEVPAGTPVTSETCMRRFEAWGRPQTKPFDVRFGPFQVHHQRWRDQKLEVHSVDGDLSLGFSTAKFSAAWAAYPAYTDGCLIYAMAVPWREHPELAQKVRDRWVDEAFAKADPKTPTHAVRKAEAQ